MNRFECSSLVGEKLKFTVRVKNYSMRACKNYYESSEFTSISPSGDVTKRSLVVYSSDGADYENYVDVRLKLNECSNVDGLFVKARVAIENRFGSMDLRNERNLFYRGCQDHQVFIVTEGYMSSYFGLNRRLLLPNDTLTLFCELDIFKEDPKSYRTRDDFEKSVEKFDESPWSKFCLSVKNNFFLLLSLLVSAYCSIVGGILTGKAVVENYLIPFFNDFIRPVINNFVILVMFVVLLLKYIYIGIKYVYLLSRKIKKGIDYWFKPKPTSANIVVPYGNQFNKNQLMDKSYNYYSNGNVICAEETTRRIYVPQKQGNYNRRPQSANFVEPYGNQFNKTQRMVKSYNYY